MLTKLTIKNFKKFGTAKVEIELANPVVFIGPNNSGKTTALQALALWEVGLHKWLDKRSGKDAPKKRTGVTINRRDLVAIPVPEANLLWRNLQVREISRVEGRQRTRNVRIEITVEGITEGRNWECGLEFDYANEEALYCRPLLNPKAGGTDRMRIPERISDLKTAFLSPLSGLAANETKLELGAINVRIGEGRTAEVIRNLCHRISETDPNSWGILAAQIKTLFGVILHHPVYLAQRGEIKMEYSEPSALKSRLDLSAAGRGLHQTLLLMAFMYGHPGSVLLIDEPDAHLEILRQRQIYRILTEVARVQQSQIIIASHSEVILNEAADQDVVVAFLGKPHRIDDRGSQLLKSLRDIGFEHYYLAEDKGWVLYLEGSTDLAILYTFAKILNHPAGLCLERPFVHYVGNKPSQAYTHFYGLKEAVRDLSGIAIYDHEVEIEKKDSLREIKWSRREIENYLWSKEVLLAYARGEPGDLFSSAEAGRRVEIMEDCMEDRIPRGPLRNPDDSWWKDEKASDYLNKIFELYFSKLKLPNLMPKSNYHQLARLVPRDLIDPEIEEKLEAILEVAQKATPKAGKEI